MLCDNPCTLFSVIPAEAGIQKLSDYQGFYKELDSRPPIVVEGKLHGMTVLGRSQNKRGLNNFKAK